MRPGDLKTITSMFRCRWISMTRGQSVYADAMKIRAAAEGMSRDG
jgi:hypothetical protein